MQYMILMSEDPSWDALSEADQAAIIEQHEQFEADLKATSSFVSSGRFGPDNGVRVEQAPTGEHTSSPAPPSGQGAIGGYYLIEADSMEQAVQWASRCRFVTGTNWVYPVWE